MKKTFLSSALLVSSLLGVSSVLAAPAPVAKPTAQEQQLKAVLLKINAKQRVTNAKIKQHLSVAKNDAKKVKRKRAIIKKHRATVKKQATVTAPATK